MYKSTFIYHINGLTSKYIKFYYLTDNLKKKKLNFYRLLSFIWQQESTLKGPTTMRSPTLRSQPKATLRSQRH